MQADSDALRRSAGSQPMGLPIGYGFTHDFALCRSAGAARQFHRLRHAFSVQMVWYLSSTYGQAHRLSSGTPSARFSHDSDDSDDSDKGWKEDRSYLPFFAKTFQILAKNWHFSEKLQKNHQKIAFFAVSGVDFAKSIAYNTCGTLCKNADFTHKTGQFYNRIMTQQDKQWAASRTERQNRWQKDCHAFWHPSLHRQKQSQIEHCLFSTTYADLPPPRVIFLSWQTVSKTPRDTSTQPLDLNGPPLRFFVLTDADNRKLITRELT